MKDYLLIFSVGPVQSFIASARNSRDLWSGSWLLSELAKACAKYLQGENAKLIFPSVTDATLLDAGTDFSVGNKIQVLVKADDKAAVAVLVKDAKKAVQARFEEVATDAVKKLGKAANDLRQDIWKVQLADYVEIQTAWAEVQDDYSKTNEQVAQALAARKATRDFSPSKATHALDNAYMLPKSSLDGARETVLPKTKEMRSLTRIKLRLADTEQLDTVGITKRLAGNPEQFTPFTRIAAHAWIQELTAEERQAICEGYESLVTHELATRVRGNTHVAEKGVHTGKKQARYADLPYDAQYLYQPALEVEIGNINKEIKKGDTSLIDAYEALKKLKTTLEPIWQRIGQPNSYGVLLLADGDKMGALLDNAKTVADHQAITQALSEFAGSVAKCMYDYDGHNIYAGGDDVLGFVPVHQAYACSDALRQLFSDSLDGVANTLGANTPTLSVGLAITHVSTPLSIIRSLAKRAEKTAKGDDAAQPRNALGICLSVRGGAISDLRMRWDDENKALEYFQKWQSYYSKDNRKLSSRIAYDMRDIYLRTDFPNQEDIERLSEIRQAEFKRMLKQAKNTDSNDLDKDVQKTLEERLEKLDNNLELFSTELIIARWLASKTQQELGKE